MKNTFTVLTLVAIMSSAHFAHASTPTSGYKIIVDAGSTSSKIHLFEYTRSGTATPVISELFTESAKPALASYANDPTHAGDSLKKLLDDVVSQLQLKGVTTPVPVNVYATAGMRMLPLDQQSPIYSDVTTFIADNYTQLTPGTIQTISGTLEGLYDWLDVNYLAENFQNQQPTIGAIDMGGSSTQLAFATTDATPRQNVTAVTVNNQAYRVFSVSFLGLGEDQARATMGNGALSTQCYPTSYPLNGSDEGAFNFSSCQLSYTKIIDHFHVDAEVPSLAGQKILAFSGIYYTYHFFMPEASTASNQTAFTAQVKNVCAEPWSQLQRNYPSESVAYLATYCANGAYIDRLLYQDYHLSDAQLTISDKVNGKNIDWTLGAALYSLLV